MSKKFQGWSIPQGTLLPPEFGQLLPKLKTLGEVKVLLVILAEYLRPGLDAQPLKYDEIQELAGLSRPTVSAALSGLRDRLGCIKRIGAPGGSYLYEPTLRKTLESLDIELPMHDSLHDHEQKQKAFAYDDMHELAKFLNEKCGVSLRVASDIVDRHDHERIKQHVAYALHAAKQGIIRTTLAAYVVASIRDNWGPPVGWEDGNGQTKKRWYTDEEFDRFFAHDDPDTAA